MTEATTHTYFAHENVLNYEIYINLCTYMSLYKVYVYSSPLYPWGIHFKIPSGCLELRIVINPEYILLCFYLYIHTCDKV